MKKNTVITLFVLLVILLTSALVVHLVQQRSQARAIQTSEAASVFANSSSTAAFTDYAGNEANLDQFLGQTLIVNSWASWAPASADELKLLTDVAKNYKDQGVVVIAINRAEPRTTAEAFLRTLGLADEVRLIVDADDHYYKATEGFTMPETIVYNTKGDLVEHKRGSITTAELTLILDRALVEPK
ncbi:MAG: thiol-disulfide isomerase/thioredoxin [Candidatus Paceibacteria bacterium]|jgi:thiol-disulfide isomerase/thioredoxin